MDLGAGLYSCLVTLDNLEGNQLVAENLNQEVLKVTVVEQDVVVDHKGEKFASTLFLVLARNGDEGQLPVVAVAVRPPVAESGGPVQHNVEPTPSWYSQDWDWRLPFLQK